MNFGPTLLLGGIVLIAAAPMWADRTSYHASANDPRNTEISVHEFGKSGLQSSTPVNEGLLTEPTLGGMLTDLSIPQAMDIHFTSPADRDSLEHVSFPWHDGMDWRGEGEEHRLHETNIVVDKKNVASVAVAEPGSLSLLLLGLAAVGFMARRPRELPTAR